MSLFVSKLFKISRNKKFQLFILQSSKTTKKYQNFVFVLSKRGNKFFLRFLLANIFFCMTKASCTARNVVYLSIYFCKCKYLHDTIFLYCLHLGVNGCWEFREH